MLNGITSNQFDMFNESHIGRTVFAPGYGKGEIIKFKKTEFEYTDSITVFFKDRDNDKRKGYVKNNSHPTGKEQVYWLDGREMVGGPIPVLSFVDTTTTAITELKHEAGQVGFVDYGLTQSLAAYIAPKYDRENDELVHEVYLLGQFGEHIMKVNEFRPLQEQDGEITKVYREKCDLAIDLAIGNVNLDDDIPF